MEGRTEQFPVVCVRCFRGGLGHLNICQISDQRNTRGGQTHEYILRIGWYTHRPLGAIQSISADVLTRVGGIGNETQIETIRVGLISIPTYRY